ncbi:MULTISPECIES: hypothetical protein [Thioclava]|uniref:hypothetical protein n=1 Tax=Thioclava TaxID=285107 RepID=UPI000B5400AD|nr:MULTISPECIES: hypothetical protein [Thioclava]OWX99691.1 hypothetical protein B6V76_17110 [Thioclava sp. IC9]OWY03457.1 hypothetical protein B6V75_08455 [Thioclava sp. F1Mire-8]OWY14268.1 hypothetical protein B6V72_03150 [Thioclava sp. F34-6]OWY15912.1 hypothetical protein B6V73_11990 [Thioclava sp. JM3]PWE51954.1 hypothetical protein DEM26_03080 [Thioclava sp. NG1]
MKLLIVPALALAATLPACTREQVTDNSVDAAKLGGRVVVNTAVGATNLGYEGGKAAYGAVRNARNQEGEAFPDGALLCSVGDGSFVKAKRAKDGSYSCPEL